MLLVRVFAAIAKPALIGGTVLSAAAGSYVAYDRLLPQDTMTPYQRVQQHGGQLLISEFGEDADAIIAVDPNDPSSRTKIAGVRHAPGWGIFATLSPDGQAIAYTALPSDAADPSPATPAVAGIIEPDGDVVVLADDADLLIPPVWAPDGQSVVVRKNTPTEDSAGTFELLLLGRDGSRATLTTWTSAAAFPVAFAPDGSKLYFTTLHAGGTDLYSVAPDASGETLVAHLSDEIAREWTLSPDGATLAYSVAESGAQPRLVAMTLDLATGVAARATADTGTGSDFNPAWTRTNELTVASVKAEGGGDAVAIAADGGTTALSDNSDSIDLPLAWSPDGATLAVRAVEGASAFAAGTNRIELLRADGEREAVSDSADVLIVGWLP